MENLLIVGVDPGTTLGYAIIDLDCNILKMSSGKMIGLSQIIRIISSVGLPLIIATDKAVVPGFIEKLNAKLGTRIFSPKTDLKVIDKKNITRGYAPKKDHERDSLAAALYAYKEILPFIKKADRFVKKENKEAYKDKLRRLMVMQQGMLPLRSTLQLLESQGKKQKHIIRKALTKNDFTKEYFNLREEYARLKKRHMLVLAQRDRLLNKKTTVQKPKIREVVLDSRLKKNVEVRDKRIRALSKKIEDLKSELKEEKSKKNLLRKVLLSYDKYKVIRTTEDLGRDASSLELKKGDILYVRDTAICSRASVEHIKRKVDVLITERKTKTAKEFIILNPKDLNMTFVDNIAVVKKRELDKKLDRRLLLKRILKEHGKRALR